MSRVPCDNGVGESENDIKKRPARRALDAFATGLPGPGATGLNGGFPPRLGAHLFRQLSPLGKKLQVSRTFPNTIHPTRDASATNYQ